MKKWPYAVATHEMSKCGGPEKYIAKIRLHEHQKTVRSVNKNWLLATVPTLAVLVPLAAKGAYDLVAEHRKKMVITDEEAHQAEQELIQACEDNESEEPSC